MHQTWEKLLFLHWPVSPSTLRPFIPKPLEIDTYGGEAWIGITPFTVSNLKLTGLPLIPGTHSFHELNVRTYVFLDGIPGVWFFTLEASKLIPTLAARTFFALNYRKANIRFRRGSDILSFKSERVDNETVDANFEAKWRPRGKLPSPAVDSLEFFLVERYCLFAAEENRIFSSQIYHSPWALRSAELLTFETTLFESLGLSAPSMLPLTHYADKQEVDIWAPQRI